MRKKLFIVLLLGLFFSCSKNDRGELIGVKSNKFFSDKPHGMVLIPSGSFTMGPSNPSVVLKITGQVVANTKKTGLENKKKSIVEDYR